MMSNVQHSDVSVHCLDGLQDYNAVLHRMQTFTQSRTTTSPDCIWLLQHHPVYTLGVQTDPAHILTSLSAPLVQSDRGGQVTYHGPGQLVCYVMMDLRRSNLTIHALVDEIEKVILATLKAFNIEGHTIEQQRGVYVDQHKIASIGLRCKKHCTYHGFALNVDMDLSPFALIHPCGQPNLDMTDMQQFIGHIPMKDVVDMTLNHLYQRFYPTKTSV